MAALSSAPAWGPLAGRAWRLAACCAMLGAATAARADIYTWTDASGKVNVSNLPPPEGARVSQVVREQPRSAADAAAEAALQRQQIQALAERVRQLESELAAPREAPPAPPPVVVAPVIQYITPPQPEALAPVVQGPATAGCDPSWYGCSFFWPSAVFPATTYGLVKTTPARYLHPYHGRITPLRPVGLGPRLPASPPRRHR